MNAVDGAFVIVAIHAVIRKIDKVRPSLGHKFFVKLSNEYVLGVFRIAVDTANASCPRCDTLGSIANATRSAGASHPVIAR